MAESSKRAVIRADATAATGGGHVMRCLTLAEALAVHGVECTFATVPETQQVAPLPAPWNASRIELDAAAATDPDETLAAIGDGWSIAILDHYGLDRNFGEAVGRVADTVVVIDELLNRPLAGTVLVDSTPGRAPADCAPVIDAHALILADADHAMLRPAFRDARKARAARDEGDAVCSVLVAFGLGDTIEPTANALAAARAAFPDASLTAVVGADTARAAALRQAALATGSDLLEAPADYAERLAAADIAIGGGGVSALERCCIGVPSVAVAIAPNQSANCQALSAAGAAVVAASENEADIAAAIEALAASGARKQMAQIARGLCDGGGARRVASAIADHEGAVRLRGATRTDEGLTLAWQSDPATRRYSRNPAPPAAEDHARWFARQLEDDGTDLLIVTDGPEPVGVLRLDSPRERGFREVSIYISPAHKRRGYAATALALARLLYPGQVFSAFVSQENCASRKLFLGAGYEPDREPGWYVQW